MGSKPLFLPCRLERKNSKQLVNFPPSKISSRQGGKGERRQGRVAGSVVWVKHWCHSTETLVGDDSWRVASPAALGTMLVEECGQGVQEAQ